MGRQVFCVPRPFCLRSPALRSTQPNVRIWFPACTWTSSKLSRSQNSSPVSLMVAFFGKWTLPFSKLSSTLVRLVCANVIATATSHYSSMHLTIFLISFVCNTHSPMPGFCHRPTLQEEHATALGAILLSPVRSRCWTACLQQSLQCGLGR